MIFSTIFPESSMIANSVTNNNSIANGGSGNSSNNSNNASRGSHLARPLHPMVAAAAAKAAAAATASLNNSKTSPTIAQQMQKAENDRRRKIAAKCLEMEEILESRG